MNRTNMRTYVNGANLLTSANLVAGFAALILAGQGQLGWAAGMVGAAALLDSVDGLLARRLDVCGPFGSQLDSLADIVAFGCAPAMMLYVGGLDSVPVAGIGACLAFVLSGAWRLARFPLVERPHRFVGLPIPPAGLIVAVLAALAPSAWAGIAVAVVLAALMISVVPFPTFRGLARLARPNRPVEVNEATALRK